MSHDLRDEFNDKRHELGPPEHLAGRHRFVFPGLVIRVPGKMAREKLDILDQADATRLDEIREVGLYENIRQAFLTRSAVRNINEPEAPTEYCTT